MSKIVLFFPKLEDKDSVLLPASVLMVAAPLIKAGYEIKIIDQRIEKDWPRVIEEELNHQPLIFGISALTGKQIQHGLMASKLVKGKSQTPVVWGGIHASLLPQQTLENQYIDFVVVGEGEETLLELAEQLKNKQNNFGEIKGLGYKKDGQIIVNPPREFVDINNLLPLPYHLIKIDNYIATQSFASGQSGRDIALYTSRGCPHRCGFCYNKEFNKRRWRGKSAERVVAEMTELVKKYKITSFNIEDDEFFVDVERAKKISELIIANDLKIEIFTSCRVNYVANQMNEKYLQLLYRAGFKTLAFGVESGSARVLDLMHKDITIDQVFKTIDLLKVAGINSKYYFMAGFPTEKINDLYQTTDLIQQMKQADPQIRIPAWRVFTPYPGTDLYDLAIKQGWQPPKSLEEWAHYDFNTVKLPWVKGNIKRIINNVAFLVYYLEMGKTVGQGIFFTLGKIFGKLVDWRWRKHFFSFLPEKYFVNFLIKFKSLLS